MDSNFGEIGYRVPDNRMFSKVLEMSDLLKYNPVLIME